MIYCLGDMFPLWLRLSFVVIFSFARLFFFWLLNYFFNVFLIFMDYTNISHISFCRGSAGCNGDTILQLNIFSLSLTIQSISCASDCLWFFIKSHWMHRKLIDWIHKEIIRLMSSILDFYCFWIDDAVSKIVL
jgi:hypothetical protein